MTMKSFSTKIVSGLFAALLVLTSQSSLAFNIIQPTKLEWDAWPKICKGATHTKAAVPKGRVRPKLNKAEAALLSKTGGWHYCIALLKLRQLELGTQKAPRERWIKETLGDINYSLSRIDLNEPWAAEMLVASARAHRQAKNASEAKKSLDKAKEYHPGYSPTYTAYAALFFDDKNYPAAIEILEQGNRTIQGRSGEVLYFLGLAYLKNDQLDKAREFEKLAKAKNYPMRYLSRKLRELENKQAQQSRPQSVTQ